MSDYDLSYFNKETHKHIRNVFKVINKFLIDLTYRQFNHDLSKFSSEEMEAFIKVTPNLVKCKYGSDEYKQGLESVRPAIDHHNAENRHHPEHFPDGIRGMTLVDIVEMFSDWMASVVRNPEGNIEKSIEINQKRFGYSDDIKCILLNTAKEYSSICDSLEKSSPYNPE
jgi:hypothetical protein